MEYILVCPTYNRIETFACKTYALLKRTNAPLPELWINECEDLDTYKQRFPELKIHKGGSNIGEKRNMIQEYYPLNTKLIFIDDDIRDIVVKTGAKTKKSLKDFNTLVEYGFQVAIQNNSTIWGVYPIDNPLWMKYEIKTQLCMIIGTLFGVVNQRVFVQSKYAVDLDLSLKYYIAQKKLLRLEFIGLKTKCYTEPGGLQTDINREEGSRLSKINLLQEYPDYITIYQRNNRSEIRFKRTSEPKITISQQIHEMFS
jgi:hypothetical protein